MTKKITHGQDDGEDAEFEIPFPGDLEAYLAGQAGTEDLRHLSQAPAYPYPSEDNPMLLYLMRKGLKMAESENAGIEKAIRWTTVHAWFEATIAERARVAGRIARLLDNE